MANSRCPEELAALREAELHDAGRALGVDTVALLGFADSGWEGPARQNAIVERHDLLVAAVSAQIVEWHPDVVVTMDPTGSDGHRDHAAVGRATTDAYLTTVDWEASLYHWCLPRSLMARWTAVESGRDPASVYLEIEMGRPDDEITTVIDGREVRAQVEDAIGHHRTQRSPYDGLPDELRTAFLEADHLVRVRPAYSDATMERSIWPVGHTAR